MSEDNSGAQGGSETFESIMGRRLMQFTMECLNHEIRIKLKSSSKLYSGTLHALDPTTLSIVVHNFNGIDERAEYKSSLLCQDDLDQKQALLVLSKIHIIAYVRMILRLNFDICYLCNNIQLLLCERKQSFLWENIIKVMSQINCLKLLMISKTVYFDESVKFIGMRVDLLKISNESLCFQALQKREQRLEDSYDEAKLSMLKREIGLPKSQLFELVHDEEKFAEKLRHFNREGCRCIDRQEFYEAIVYLNEAQLTLQYAASCGLTIQRTLITSTLHNLACVYQRIWELEKSADYVQGVIYNITAFLQSEQQPSMNPPFSADSSHATQFAALLQSKLKLVSYFLQFCAVSSQLKRHENSLNAASRALDLLKEVCQQEQAWECGVGKRGTQVEKNMLLQLRNIKDFKEEDAEIDRNLERFLNKARKSVGIFHKKIKFPNTQLDHKQKMQLQEFSIGSVMQIYPQCPQQIIDPQWLAQELTPLPKIYKALYISIAHFTMATELRLIAGLRQPSDITARRLSTEYKSSQLHHLVALITVALYVPYETVYFQHILNSFRTHYQLDLSQPTQSTLSQQLSSLGPDDEIHLQISSLYRKKQEQGGKTQKSIIKADCKQATTSPSMHDQAKKSKPKTKNSKVSMEHSSVKLKCKMIADSQRKLKEKEKQKEKAKSNAKSVSKKSKSRKKVDSHNRDNLLSPNSQRRTTPHIPAPPSNSNIPSTSKSKSKAKKKSGSKHTSQYSGDKGKKDMGVRSQQQYGLSTKVNKGLISRTIKAESKDKKSLRSSQRRSDMKNDLERKDNEIRFIRHAKSPNNVPKPNKAL